MVKTNRKMIKPFMVGFPHQTVGLQEGLVALFLMIPMISAQPTAFRQGSVAVLGLSEPVITSHGGMCVSGKLLPTQLGVS